MRLICPNCDAQYEVPDEVMPVTGRDVQCSDCGQTWFQHHPDHAPQGDDAETAPFEDAFKEDEFEGGEFADDEFEDDEPEDVIPAPEPDTAPADHPFPNLRAEVAASAAPATPPTRRQLDPAVAEILRQEAAAEQEARRRRQAAPLESQPELGLDEGWPDDDVKDAPQPDAPEEQPEEDRRPRDNDAERRAHEARVRMARMRGEPEPTAPGEGAAPRRDLLPDIEEINSTLRHDGGQEAGPTPTAALDKPAKERSSGGFMRGFVLMMALAAALALVYVYAPQIAQTVPQADPYLSSYVAWMDDARIWLDGQLQDLLVWLDSMASQSQG